MPFDGLRVLSLESRRSEEMAILIRKQGGEPTVAPSMREVPLEHQQEALDFGAQLSRGSFDGIIFLTGVGTRMLWKTLCSQAPESHWHDALGKVTRVVRGPKPAAALRELNLPAHVQIPEPNTWREILAVMESRPEKSLALQEYGKSNHALIEGLRAFDKTVTPVRIYGWELPEDVTPLRNAVAKLISGQLDVALFTTSVQMVHLMLIAAEEGVDQQVIEALNAMCVASIGPTTTEALTEYGVHPDFEPTHPKMGLLVNELAPKAAPILSAKR